VESTNQEQTSSSFSVAPDEQREVNRLLHEIETEQLAQSEVVERLHAWAVGLLGIPADYRTNPQAVIHRRDDAFIYHQLDKLGKVAERLAYASLA